MEQIKALSAIEKRAFKARISITHLCKQAHVSPATIARWRKHPETIRASTIAKLERRLSAIEAR